jgi:hypothetical protein
MMLNLAHWNPHWECFAKEPMCKANATAALTTLLTSACSPTGCSPTGVLDFASIIEFEVADYVLPPGWAAIGLDQSCGYDWATLFYNADRWTPVHNSSITGCVSSGRSFAASAFMSATSTTPLAVVSAHFPQTQHNMSAYADATASLRNTFSRLGAGHAVIMADTNTESPSAAAAHPYHNTSGGVNRTNAQLLSDIGLWARTDEPPAAALFDGCCCTPFGPWDTPFSWQGDRIIANVGSAIDSRHLFDPAPQWACSDELRKTTGSEFHKGVHLTLSLP